MAKILLVDDDLDFVEISKALLEKDHHVVVVAHNPKDGLAQLKKEKPDLLILDVMMEAPDDGFAMAQKLRLDGNKIPIIMLTSINKVTGLVYGKDKDMVPVQDYFEKPIPADKLRAAVKKYVK